MPLYVRIVRVVVRVLQIVGPLSLIALLYSWLTTPYGVRYWEERASGLTSVGVGIVNKSHSEEQILVRLTSGQSTMEDVAFRPILSNAPMWSFRQLFAAIEPRVDEFLGVSDPKLVDLIADRHVSGGLRRWKEESERRLRSQVLLSLRATAGSAVNENAISRLADAYMRLSDRHQRTGLIPPNFLKQHGQIEDKLEQTQEDWERQVSAVIGELSQRWRSVTGTTILGLPPAEGNPAMLMALKPDEGCFLEFRVAPGALLPATVEVQAADPVYKVRDFADASSSSYHVLAKDWWYKLTNDVSDLFGHWYLVGVAFLLTVGWILIALGTWIYRTSQWPGKLDEVVLFNSAQMYQTDELWLELRRRHVRFDDYVVEGLLLAKLSPTEASVKSFWSELRRALRSTPVTAGTAEDVEDTLLRFAFRKLLHVSR